MNPASPDASLVRAVRERSRPLDDAALDELVDRIGGCRVVLLGEATHGTHEYYSLRARISRRLIERHGFDFIAVEGDWPDCYEINRYVKGTSPRHDSARSAAGVFHRWPTWMWGNWEIVAFAETLRKLNEDRHPQRSVGFYGLDVYSLWESLDAVFEHLRESHPDAVRQAKETIGCFEPFERDAQTYAWATRYVPTDCEHEVIRLLSELMERGPSEDDDPEAHFSAEQNARAAVGAEAYYRAMVANDASSWNVRDRHMDDTLDRLLDFHGRDSKGIVWAHNTHNGDARFTDMRDAGMVNLGQLARERHGEENVALVGFSSYEGTVIAGRSWGGRIETMLMPRAREGSWEAIFHAAGGEDRLLFSGDLRDLPEAQEVRGHRAIGVVYHPERERLGNYVPTRLDRRYDALLYIDKTRALHPLGSEATSGGAPETYPWGL